MYIASLYIDNGGDMTTKVVVTETSANAFSWWLSVFKEHTESYLSWTWINWIIAFLEWMRDTETIKHTDMDDWLDLLIDVEDCIGSMMFYNGDNCYIAVRIHELELSEEIDIHY